MPRLSKQRPRWRPLTEALADPEVSGEDKLAIGAACIEEEALMRTMVIIHGKERAPAEYVAHGGRFRFDGEGRLCILVPVPPGWTAR